MEKEVFGGSSLGPHPGPLPTGEGVTTNSWHTARLAPLPPDLTCFAFSQTNNMARSHYEFPIRRRFSMLKAKRFVPVIIAAILVLSTIALAQQPNPTSAVA